MNRMNTGAQSLVDTAVRAGVEVCFANPGTTEMPIVRGARPRTWNACRARTVRGRVHRRRRRVGTHDGTARRDAAAPRARPCQRPREPAQCAARTHTRRQLDRRSRHPDTSRSTRRSLRTSRRSPAAWAGRAPSRRAHEMAEASLAAVEAALGPPGRVASLIIPADCQWEPGPEPLSARPRPALRETPSSALPRGGAPAA